MKNLTKCNNLKTFALKSNGKFVDYNLENCIFGPWPWLSPFLTLTSRGSILKKPVLNFDLGFGFFPSVWS